MCHSRRKGLFVGPSKLTMRLALDEPVCRLQNGMISHLLGGKAKPWTRGPRLHWRDIVGRNEGRSSRRRSDFRHISHLAKALSRPAPGNLVDIREDSSLQSSTRQRMNGRGVRAVVFLSALCYIKAKELPISRPGAHVIG